MRILKRITPPEERTVLNHMKGLKKPEKWQLARLQLPGIPPHQAFTGPKIVHDHRAAIAQDERD